MFFINFFYNSEYLIFIEGLQNFYGLFSAKKQRLCSPGKHVLPLQSLCCLFRFITLIFLLYYNKLYLCLSFVISGISYFSPFTLYTSFTVFKNLFAERES